MRRWGFNIALLILGLGFLFFLTQACISSVWGGISTEGIVRHPMSERLAVGLRVDGIIIGGCLVVYGIGRVLGRLLEYQAEEGGRP